MSIRFDMHIVKLGKFLLDYGNLEGDEWLKEYEQLFFCGGCGDEEYNNGFYYA